MDYTGKRAWIYAYIEAPEDNHGVLKGQEKELYNYSEQMGLILSGISSDLDIGSNINMTGLEQVIAAALDRRFDVLLIKNTDRLRRTNGRTAEIFRQLYELGVTAYSPTEGEISLGSLLL